MYSGYTKESIELYNSEINNFVERRTNKIKIYLNQKVIFSENYLIDSFFRKKLVAIKYT